MSKEDFITHGYTAGCGGCVALQRNLNTARNHTEVCRARMEAEIEKTREGRERKQRAAERIDDQLTRELELEDEMIQRKAAAQASGAYANAKGASSGKDGQKGRGKGGGKKGGKGGGKKGKGKAGENDARANCALDASLPRASAILPANFPRNAIGLDTWANVHMIHQKKSRSAPVFDHTLTLAHGTCKCHREVGRKGVPKVFVPWTEGQDNIDLFPEGFLRERGCSISRGQEHTLSTPKGRVVQIKMWGTLPYILKDDLQRVIDDLPEESVPGRSGQQVSPPTAARVC